MTDTSQNALVIENLSKRYRGAESPAVDGLSLRIRQGEIFGLLGPNGAGKTTSISILSTLLAPSGGRVLMGEIDCRQSPRQARRRIGLVPQEIALYPELTARENLSFFGKLQGLGGKDLRSGIRMALAAVGLETNAHRRVATFSGGMKRRANLAAGILHRPPLLLLDEPTVGIDAQSRQLIMEKLEDLKAAGTTMVYTTHYMEEAQRLCDRVAIMDKGRILAMGTPDALLADHPGSADLGELFLELTGKELRD
jgi:ABC-2 type transport system ATP-binding protein